MKLRNTTVRLFEGSTCLLEDLPPRAVALDGMVQGPEQGKGDRWSLDHHAGCLRLATLATCEQVRTVLLLGGVGWFDGRDVYVNDLDGDTLLSLWLVENPHRVNEYRVRGLVRAVGAVDAHGPSGALLLSEEEREMANAFFQYAIAPVQSLRGRVREVFAEWPDLIRRCLDGITELADDRTPKVEMPKAVVIVDLAANVRGLKLCLGTCEGFGFQNIYERGYDAAVLYQRAADNSAQYTIAKRSDLVPLNIGPASDPTSALGRLAALEPGWGGGSSIGGSPRLPGGVSSRLRPDQVWEQFLKAAKR